MEQACDLTTGDGRFSAQIKSQTGSEDSCAFPAYQIDNTTI
jgi:hypothetical protein